MPVTKFSKVPPSEFATYDDRYIPAEIVVMHSGDNLNGSNFSESAIAENAWSLVDIPILGFVKKVNDEKNDFDGHNVEVVMTDDDYKIRHLGRIIGNIPKENNYHYTYYPEKEELYVTVEGYLWVEYMNEALEIFKNNRQKSVSMEIVIDDGFFDERDIFCITKYRYLGICILGDDVNPAMEGAKITVGDVPIEIFSQRDKEKEVIDLDKERDAVVVEDEFIETPTEEAEIDKEGFVETETDTKEVVEEVPADEPEMVEEPAEETPFEEPEDVAEASMNPAPTLTDEERAELEDLRIFKANVLEEQRVAEVEALFAKCEQKGIDVTDVRESADGKTVAELEQEIALIVLNNTFSAVVQTLPETDSKQILKDVSKSENSPYGKFTERLKK